MISTFLAKVKLSKRGVLVNCKYLIIHSPQGSGIIYNELIHGRLHQQGLCREHVSLSGQPLTL